MGKSWASDLVQRSSLAWNQELAAQSPRLYAAQRLADHSHADVAVERRTKPEARPVASPGEKAGLSFAPLMTGVRPDATGDSKGMDADESNDDLDARGQAHRREIAAMQVTCCTYVPVSSGTYALHSAHVSPSVLTCASAGHYCNAALSVSA